MAGTNILVTNLEVKSLGLMDDSRLAPSQWETSLQSNAVSHWLGAKLESSLGLIWRLGMHRLNLLYLILKWAAVTWLDTCQIKWKQRRWAIVTHRMDILPIANALDLPQSFAKTWTRSTPGPLFTKKTPSYQYRDSHYKPETVLGLSWGSLYS